VVKLVPPLKMAQLEQESDLQKKKGLAAFIMMQNKAGWGNSSRVSTPAAQHENNLGASEGAYNRLEEEQVFDLNIGRAPIWQNETEPDSPNDIILMEANCGLSRPISRVDLLK